MSDKPKFSQDRGLCSKLTGQRFLFLSGKESIRRTDFHETVLPARQEQQSEDKEPLEEGPFSLVINTNFKTIVGGDISYETSFNCQGEILSWNDLLSASSLDKADFLEISSFRLGFEHFVPSMFGAMIGSTPTIRSRFYLSASPEEIIVSIESDNKASPEFDVNSLAQHIRQACQAANFEIVS